jgi:hypothetical protein
VPKSLEEMYGDLLVLMYQKWLESVGGATFLMKIQKDRSLAGEALAKAYYAGSRGMTTVAEAQNLDAENLTQRVEEGRPVDDALLTAFMAGHFTDTCRFPAEGCKADPGEDSLYELAALHHAHVTPHMLDIHGLARIAADEIKKLCDHGQDCGCAERQVSAVMRGWLDTVAEG